MAFRCNSDRCLSLSLSTDLSQLFLFAKAASHFSLYVFTIFQNVHPATLHALAVTNDQENKGHYQLFASYISFIGCKDNDSLPF